MAYPLTPQRREPQNSLVSGDPAGKLISRCPDSHARAASSLARLVYFFCLYTARTLLVFSPSGFRHFCSCLSRLKFCATIILCPYGSSSAILAVAVFCLTFSPFTLHSLSLRTVQLSLIFLSQRPLLQPPIHSQPLLLRRPCLQDPLLQTRQLLHKLPRLLLVAQALLTLLQRANHLLPQIQHLCLQALQRQQVQTNPSLNLP